MMNFKPMLSADASTVDLTTLRYPLLVSSKLDGVRCIVWDGVAYSRNAKPIRNHFVQAWAKNLHNLDGELIVGSATDPHCLANTQSGVMSYDGEPDFTFHLFDMPERDCSFEDVYADMLLAGDPDERTCIVEHTRIETVADLRTYELACIYAGYEGIMMRDPRGAYKYGRSTLREGGLMKLKRFQDGEAVVVGLEEGHVNDNTLERDELGRAKRSKVSSGLRPSGMVGTIIADDPVWGRLRIAPGTMTHGERLWHWENQDNVNNIMGKTIHWRSFGYGVKDKPRFPRYYGIRSDV